MMKIPVENLGLFEQLDRIVVAFFSKQQPSSPYDLNVSITQEHLDQKKQELEPLGYQAVQLPLGMALDNVITSFKLPVSNLAELAFLLNIIFPLLYFLTTIRINHFSKYHTR